MPAIMYEPKTLDAALIQPAERLSELHLFFRRFERHPNELIVYDDGFRGWTFVSPR